MQKQSLLYGIIGLLGGIIITWATAVIAVNNDRQGMMNMMGMHTNMHSDEGMTMDDMVNDLKGKTGDDFDEAYIAGMIEHHQGAIDMAELAKQNAKHQEIKDMADDIISAQSTEIEQMQNWQNEWGYNASQGHQQMNH